MRILWFGHRDSEHPKAGGAERTIREIGSRLVRFGHEVTLVSSQWRGASKVTTIDGVSILRFPGNFGPHIAAGALLSRIHPDVIVDDLAHAAPWFSPWVTSTPGTAFFHHLHQRTLSGQTSGGLRLALATAERFYPGIYRGWPFVTESQTALRDLLNLGIERYQVRCIPPGTDLDLFKPAEKSVRPQLVYFGGLRRYKRPSVAVGLTHLLRRTGFDVKLIFVGEGPMLEDIRRLSQELGVSESIDFVGRVDDAELSRIVAASWVNVHTSVSEGWGFSISEAAACGTPTVAFSVPGVSESVGNGITGILAQDGDTTALAEACASILKEPEPWFSRCKLEGRRRPWDIVAADWEHYLKLVMTEE